MLALIMFLWLSISGIASSNEDSSPSSYSCDGTTTNPIVVTSATTIAGRIYPLFVRTLDKFNHREAQKVLHRVQHVFHYQDLLAIIFLGWCTVPLAGIIYRGLCVGSFLRSSTSEEPRSFTDTRVYVVIFYFAQAIQLSLLVYLVDLFIVICCVDEKDLYLTVEGKDAATNRNDPDDGIISSIDVSWVIAKTLYTLWGARVTAKLKHYLLIEFLGQKKKKDGLALLIDHLMNAMIGGVAAMIIIDILELSGLGIRSAFALGSAGTLAITLGTQTLVSHIVSGFTLTTSNRFYVGDFVKLGSGAGGWTGVVVKMGYLETVVRAPDESMNIIPNAKLEGISVSNLTRNVRSQVKQKLRFHYDDIHKLPEVLHSIKEEIIGATTPYIVTDGSRPCRVVLTDFAERYLEVLVDVHFDGIKPIGNKYWNNRQTVLLAIQRAIDKHDVEFVVLKGCGCCLSS